MVVSRRSGKSRAPGSAGPPDGRVACRSHRLLPVRPTKPSQDTPRNLPVWLGAPGVCWPTRTACHRAGHGQGPLVPSSASPPAVAAGTTTSDHWSPAGGRRVVASTGQPAPASRSAVVRPIPHEQQPVTSTAFETPIHSFLPFVSASCPSSARRQDQPEHRVPRCLSRELLVRALERHVEIRAGDRHLREVLPKDRDAVFGLPPIRRVPGRRPLAIVTSPAARAFRTQFVTP